MARGRKRKEENEVKMAQAMAEEIAKTYKEVTADRIYLFFERLASGASFEEAMQAANLNALQIAELMRYNKKFQELWDKWREGMLAMCEVKVVEGARRGRVSAAIHFLRAHQPEKWSERLQIHQLTEQRSEVRIYFGWQPSDAPPQLSQAQDIHAHVIDVETQPQPLPSSEATAETINDVKGSIRELVDKRSG